MSVAGTAMLSLEQTPPLAVPLRFFLTAPLFGLAAVLLAVVAGPDLLVSRWRPDGLAVVHLLTLGYLVMVMAGAMFQLLPVLAGVQVSRPLRGSAVVHGLLAAGAALLAAAFVTGRQVWFAVAVVVLLGALSHFIVLAARALARARSLHDTVTAMRLALAALVVTGVLGAWLGGGHAGWMPLPREYTDLHLAWGLLGWGGLLLVGVAYQVVPMFQVTNAYPRWLRRGWAWATVAVLIAWSAFGDRPRVPGYLLAMLFSVFALTTLRLQHQRQRRLPDVTVAFWRVAMVCVLAAAGLWCLAPWLPATLAVASAWGVLVLIGVGVSAISGMLYKIVPFLVWLHLNNHLQANGRWQGGIPTMRQIIAERWMRRHLLLHGAGLLLLLAAALVSPWCFYPGLAALAGAFALQGWNLAAAMRLYRRVAAQ